MKRHLRGTVVALLALAALFSGFALADTGREILIGLCGDGCKAESRDVETDGNTVIITAGGTYALTGELTDGCVRVQCPKDDSVTLILRGVSVTNTQGPALEILSADDVEIVLAEDSVNSLVSGIAPEDVLTAQPEEEASGGALCAKCDTALSGEGSLFVGGYINNGIHVTKDLEIAGGAVTVRAVHNAVKGKDSVTVTGGTLALECSGNGIISDDENGGGVISVCGGLIGISCSGDAMQASLGIEVSGGSIEAVTGGGHENGAVHAAAVPGFGRFGRFDGFGEEDYSPDADEVSGVSAKGLKSDGALEITGGSVLLDCADDALHAATVLTVSGGSVSVASGDDGLHSDGSLCISGGSVEVTASYEGLEARTIEVLGGDISVIAQDDGLNANGGMDMFSADRRGGPVPEEDAETAEEMPLVRIAGGSLYVLADGDGLDSNGDLLLEGGTVTVDGPVNGANGALDYGSENGGSCRATGGTLLAIGAAGMAECFDTTTAQACLFLNIDIPAGAEIRILDPDGNELFFHTAPRAAGNLVFTDPALCEGDLCTVSVNGSTVTAMAYLGSNSGSFGGPGDFGRGGRRQDPDGSTPEMPADGTAPQVPDGMTPPDGTVPQMPDGMTPPNGAIPGNGMIPQMPDGKTPPDGTVPQMPDGMTPPDGTAPQMPDGMTLPNGAIPGNGMIPQPPDGMTPPDGAAPDMPSDGTAPQTPGAASGTDE